MTILTTPPPTTAAPQTDPQASPASSSRWNAARALILTLLRGALTYAKLLLATRDGDVLLLATQRLLMGTIVVVCAALALSCAAIVVLLAMAIALLWH